MCSFIYWIGENVGHERLVLQAILELLLVNLEMDLARAYLFGLLHLDEAVVLHHGDQVEKLGLALYLGRLCLANLVELVEQLAACCINAFQNVNNKHVSNDLCS